MSKEVKAYLVLVSYDQFLRGSGGLFRDFGSFIIIAVFCAVEDWLEAKQPLRRRGPKPKLSDS